MTSLLMLSVLLTLTPNLNLSIPKEIEIYLIRSVKIAQLTSLAYTPGDLLIMTRHSPLLLRHTDIDHVQTTLIQVNSANLVISEVELRFLC